MSKLDGAGRIKANVDQPVNMKNMRNMKLPSQYCIIRLIRGEWEAHTHAVNNVLTFSYKMK